MKWVRITLTASTSRIRKALTGFPWIAYRSTRITRSITTSRCDSVFARVLCTVPCPEMGGISWKLRTFRKGFEDARTCRQFGITRRSIRCYAQLPFRCSVSILKFWGMLVMFGAIAILFVPLWLDKSPVRQCVEGWYSRIALLSFVVAFLILGVLGTQAVSLLRQP